MKFASHSTRMATEASPAPRKMEFIRNNIMMIPELLIMMRV